jgi:hypothetical protein
MGFSDRLGKAIDEAQSDATLSAQNRIEKSKQDQHVKMVERYADQAVDALDKILRVLKLPEVKDLPAVQAMQVQYKNLIVELGNEGTMRRSLMATLSTPTQAVPDTRQSLAQQMSLHKIM